MFPVLLHSWTVQRSHNPISYNEPLLVNSLCRVRVLLLRLEANGGNGTGHFTNNGKRNSTELSWFSRFKEIFRIFRIFLYKWSGKLSPDTSRDNVIQLGPTIILTTTFGSYIAILYDRCTVVTYFNAMASGRHSALPSLYRQREEGDVTFWNMGFELQNGLGGMGEVYLTGWTWRIDCLIV